MVASVWERDGALVRVRIVHSDRLAILLRVLRRLTPRPSRRLWSSGPLAKLSRYRHWVITAAVAVTLIVVPTVIVVAGFTDPAVRWRSALTEPLIDIPEDPQAAAAEIAATLPDEDLVGQVLMPTIYGDDAYEVSDASRAANGGLTPAEVVQRYRLGGVILMRQSADDPTATHPTSNLDNPAQVRRLTSGLQRAALELPAGVPMLIGIDQEHGVVTRMREGMTLLPTAMAFGAIDDPELTERAATVSATELSALGINLIFAPDADVITDPDNQVIGSRSYGSDPELVARHVAATVTGIEQAGVASALKHFPGHGRTSTDSHEALPVLTQSMEQLRSEDLLPFEAGIAAGTRFVMSGHLDVQAIDPGVPASLSSRVLVDLLREQLGFDGVVITDSLQMEPVARFGPEEAAVRALLAGNDILLMPSDLDAAYHGLLEALHSGRLPRERLVEAVTRIITAKFEVAAVNQRPDLSIVGSPEHQRTAQEIAAAAVTVLRGPCDGPLITGPVRVTGGREEQRTWLSEALQDYGVALGDGGVTVHLAGYGDSVADVAREAGDVTVSMDAPYQLRQADSPVLLAAFGANEFSLRAVAAVLVGEASATGRSPVLVDGLPVSACV